MQQTSSTLLPEQYLCLRSDNIAEARETISRAYDSHCLTPLGPKREADISLYHAALNSVSLSIVGYQTDVNIDVAELTGIYVLMPIHGRLEVQSDGGQYHCEPGQAVVLNTGVALQKTLRDDYKQLVLKFDVEAVTQQLHRLCGVSLPAPVHFQPCLERDSKAGASWWRTVHYVLEELRNCDTQCSQQLVTEPLEQLLIQRLLHCQPHNHSQTLNTPSQPSLSPWYVKRAEQYLCTNACEPLSLASLAQTVGVSERSLQYGFKKSHGVSPMQYLKTLRLERARQNLLSAQPADSVTSIALACGFRQLGEFSRQYKQRFGESPSVTLRRVGCQSVN